MESDGLMLLDTSVLIEFLRDTKSPAANDVQKFIETGCGAWCDIIRLELWAGARGAQEKRAIQDLSDALTMLETTSDVWKKANILAQQCRSSGLTIPAADLLICATALNWGCEILSSDAHIRTVFNKFCNNK